jgi:ABC-type nitrate/sulfonate/bicarbonate transport system substrate-binding protein
MNRSRRTLLQTVPALVSFPLVSLASCGTSTTNPADAMKLKVAQNSGAMSYFPIYLADKQGMFKAQGLTLDPDPPTQTGTGPITTKAVEAGDIELAAGIITDAFTLARVDSQIKLLGMLMSDLLTDVTLTRSFWQQAGLTESSPLTEKVQVLRGKKVGVTAHGAATEAFLVYLFRQQGLDAKKELQIESLGGSKPANALAALRNGSVDAVCFPAPAGLQAELAGIGQRLISSQEGRSDVPALRGLVNCILYAKQDTITAKPNAVMAFIRAIAQAQAFLQKHPDQAKILLGQYLKLDQQTTKLVAQDLMPSFPATPTISKAGYDAATTFHVDGGLLAIKPRYEAIVDTTTMTRALSS